MCSRTKSDETIGRTVPDDSPLTPGVRNRLLKTKVIVAYSNSIVVIGVRVVDCTLGKSVVKYALLGKP